MLSIFLNACDMIEYHPYDGRISGERRVNEKNIKSIESICAEKRTIRFIWMGDSQRFYDETEDFVDNINERDDIDFVIHGGDVSDFGATKEFIWMRDIMNKLSVPYVVLLGNHDCLGNGEDIFREIFGEVNFSFLAGNVKFICLNTNALEFDYSRPVPDFAFMEKEYEDDREEYEKTIFAMHVRPFSEQFNNNVAKVFQEFIQKFPDLQFCLNAHDHQFTADNLFEDGVIYYGTPNVKKRQYLVFTINADDTYDYELVDFKNILFVFTLIVLFPCPILGQSKYEDRIDKYRSRWKKLIPTHYKIQYAGGMGLISLGTGWDYGKNNQWETDVFLGFLPKYSTKDNKLTFTLKQNFMPWRTNLGRGFSSELLSCGLYLNTVLNGDFWVSDPDKYPDGYYTFSTRLRIYAYLGQRLTYNIPKDKRFFAKAVTLFYEVSTNDLYVISAAGNKYLKPDDYLKLSFGLKFQFF